MPEKPQERSYTTLEELSISNMYSIEAVVELLEEKGLLNKDQVLEKIKEISGRKKQDT